ncbi:MAG: Holliday junction ATP-dependent DNA helicase RuvB [Sodalis sp. Fle]|nr:MAG: Holliday junction ATP-dependent DNA helicase RuvB [Sodalis sp. Fle]
MSYQVLARKWRPQTFVDVVGQKHILTALANSLSLGKIHHAYLLSGTRGVGKTTIARLLAKGLNCKIGITATPCGKCENCREIELGLFVDLLDLDAASRTKVEDTRELLDNIQYSPSRGRFKVYLIDEVHMLSRHSFNALLKTLEEPPAHVKFLLATTDPQKLPMTILSRCIQFHLKALDVAQIRGQLAHILQQEQIDAEPSALQLLARAADGSMRDALSLTEQAIALGQGKISADSVSLMLGTLNTEQPIALIEALVNTNGNAIMEQIAQCASHGVDWENLLVEMLSLLHRVAMHQLLPDQLNDDEEQGILTRLYELAKNIPPADLQLYYQILLVGRKELPYAPNRRMGVEMTLLRALAFHPSTVVHSSSTIDNAEQKMDEYDSLKETTPTINIDTKRGSTRTKSAHHNTIGDRLIDETSTSLAPRGITQVNPKTLHSRSAASGKPDFPQQPDINAADKNLIQAQATRKFSNDNKKNNWQEIIQMPELDDVTIRTPDAEPIMPSVSTPDTLPDNTIAQLLQARATLLQRQESKKIKKGKPELALKRQKTTINALERLAIINKRAPLQPEVCQEKPLQALQSEVSRNPLPAIQQAEQHPERITTLKTQSATLKNIPLHLATRLAKESFQRDPWAAQVHRLAMPKIVQQLALNSWKEDLAPSKICLHLRSNQRYLNSALTQNLLREALSADLGLPVELTIIEDDNPAVKTPLEWRQAIYEEKLLQARETITADTHIQMLQRFFDAELNEDSIRPV